MTVNPAFVLLAFALGLTVGYFLSKKTPDEQTLKRIGDKLDKAIADIKTTI